MVVRLVEAVLLEFLLTVTCNDASLLHHNSCILCLVFSHCNYYVGILETKGSTSQDEAPLLNAGREGTLST